MSLYSDMTDSRDPGRMVFRPECTDYWQWESQREGDGILAQYVPDGRGGYERSGQTLALESFKSTTPNEIKIKWTDGGSTITVTNELDSDSNGKGGIARVDRG